jgi:hypothetical protein
MGLSYHFSFRASADISADDLAAFLENVGGVAKFLGFDPTIVVSGPFDTPERCEFARRIARGRVIEDDRLRGVALPRESCWEHYPESGRCRLAPEYGVVLVVTDERGRESVFGFFRHPAQIRDCAGQVVMDVPNPHEWSFGDFIDSPDPRYRAIVRRFREAGYLASELDEFIPADRR